DPFLQVAYDRGYDAGHREALRVCWPASDEAAAKIHESPVDELRDDQRRQPCVLRGAWRTLGRSAQAADRRATEDAIQVVYASAGIPAPERIVWCESPLGLALTNAIVLNQVASLRPSVWTSVWPIVGDCVRESIRASVGEHIWAAIGVKPWSR